MGMFQRGHYYTHSAVLTDSKVGHLLTEHGFKAASDELKSDNQRNNIFQLKAEYLAGFIKIEALPLFC